MTGRTLRRFHSPEEGGDLFTGPTREIGLYGGGEVR